MVWSCETVPLLEAILSQFATHIATAQPRTITLSQFATHIATAQPRKKFSVVRFKGALYRIVFACEDKSSECVMTAMHTLCTCLAAMKDYKKQDLKRRTGGNWHKLIAFCDDSDGSLGTN